MTTGTETPGAFPPKEPRILCLGGALVIALATFVMPWLSFRDGGIQAFWFPYGGSGFPLLLILAVTGLGIAALNRSDETIDRCMALSAVALTSVTVGLCLARGASFETFVAFVGAMGCLAGVAFVFFPSLFERATTAARGSEGPPPGWYDDPAGGPGIRWWDGRGWAQGAPAVEAARSAAGLPGQYARPEGATDVRA